MYEGKFETVEQAAQYCKAGNAIVTLVSNRTGVRYTYKITKPKPDENGTSYAGYFVKLLTGPENTSDYTYLGIINAKGSFQVTKASRLPQDAAPCKAISFALRCFDEKQLPPSFEVWHTGRCGRCGRMLTVPESVAAGLGPECAGKM